MIRISVYYPSGEGKKFDMDYYTNKHMKLVRERMGSFGVVRTEVDNGVAGGHVYVNLLDGWQKGMGQHGKEIMAGIPNYTNIAPQIQISEIVG